MAYDLGNEELNERVRQLVADTAPNGNQDLIEELIITALKLHRDGASRGDLKLITTAVKEMRYSNLVFSRHKEPKVTIYGSARLTEDDPNYALAYTGIATAYTELGEIGLLPPDQAYPRAKAAADKALALDPDLGDAHCTVAFCKMVYEFDWKGSEAEFKRAIELAPNNADAHDLYARVLTDKREYERAFDEWDMAVRIAPHHTGALKGLAFLYFKVGDIAQAEAHLEAARKVDPNDPSLEQAFEMIRDGGRMVAVGIAPGKTAAPVEITRLVRRELRIVGSYGARTRSDMPEIIRLAARGIFRPETMVTQRFSLADADAAYKALARGEIVGRAIVVP